MRAVLRLNGEVFDIRGHRDLRSTVYRLVQRRELVEVLPRIYVTPKHRNNPIVLLRALTRWDPKCVVTGNTAWQLLTGKTPTQPFSIALPSTAEVPKWVRRVRRAIPHEWIINTDQVRLSNPVYVAVEAAANDGGEKLFTVLRQGMATVDDLLPTLHLFRGTKGNGVRRAITHQCLRKPWSFAELQLQQLLLAHDLDGWVANHPFIVGGKVYIPDLYFRGAGLVVEFDSWEFHGSRSAFESDRHKQNKLTQCGLRIVRITWRMLTEDPESVVSTIQDSLQAAD